MIEDIFDGGHRRVSRDAPFDWDQHSKKIRETYERLGLPVPPEMAEGAPSPQGASPYHGGEGDPAADTSYDPGETHYGVKPGADWAAWDDVNGVLSFMTDEEVMENYRANVEELGQDEDFGGPYGTDAATPEEAWAVVKQIWEGDPGGRGVEERVPEGATWVTVKNPSTYTWSGETALEWHSGPPPADVQFDTEGYGRPPRDEPTVNEDDDTPGDTTFPAGWK